MSSYYQFPNINCGKAGACDAYIRANINNKNDPNLNWLSNFQGISTVPLIIYCSSPLTDGELAGLTTLINAYVDPAIFLSFNHVETFPSHTPSTNNLSNSIINDNLVLQTFIFSAKQENNVVLDSAKTIVEFICPNVKNFLNITTGSTLETGLCIQDITRNIMISSQDVNIDNIITIWHDLAATGSTQSNSQFKAVQYTGLMNKNPSYDCIWQLCSPAPFDSNFTFRCHSLQYIYYDVE